MEKVTVEISKKSAEFLKTLANAIDSQDNRATGKPYFFIIKKERWRACKEGYASGTSRKVWVDFEGDPTTWHSKEEFMKDRIADEMYGTTPAGDPEAYEKALLEVTQEADQAWEEFEEFEEEQYFEEENCFLTYAAYEEHVRLNGHNLGKRGGDYHSYLKHAFRNPEMQSLFEAIGEFK